MCVYWKRRQKKNDCYVTLRFPTRLKMLVAAKDSCEATHYDCLWSFLLWAATSVEKITTFPLMNQDLLLTRYYCLFHSDRKYSPLTGTANIGSHQIKWRFLFFFSCTYFCCLPRSWSHPLHSLLSTAALFLPSLTSSSWLLTTQIFFTDQLNEDSLGMR